MDFHTLNRKQLQSLCKKHGIPANKTNLQMADLLTLALKEKGDSIPKEDRNEKSFKDEQGNSKKVRFSPDIEIREYEPSGYKRLAKRTRRTTTMATSSSNEPKKSILRDKVGNNRGDGGETGKGARRSARIGAIFTDSELVNRVVKSDVGEARKGLRRSARIGAKFTDSELVNGVANNDGDEPRKGARQSTRNGSKVTDVGLVNDAIVDRAVGEAIKGGRRSTRIVAKLTDDGVVNRNTRSKAESVESITAVEGKDEVKESSKGISRASSKRQSVAVPVECGQLVLKESRKRRKTMNLDVVNEDKASLETIEQNKKALPPVSNPRKSRRKTIALNPTIVAEPAPDEVMGKLKLLNEKAFREENYAVKELRRSSIYSGTEMSVEVIEKSQFVAKPSRNLISDCSIEGDANDHCPSSKKCANLENVEEKLKVAADFGVINEDSVLETSKDGIIEGVADDQCRSSEEGPNLDNNLDNDEVVTKTLDDLSPFKGKMTDAVGDSSCYESEIFEQNSSFQEGESVVAKRAVESINLAGMDAGKFPETAITDMSSTRDAEEPKEQFEELTKNGANMVEQSHTFTTTVNQAGKGSSCELKLPSPKETSPDPENEVEALNMKDSLQADCKIFLHLEKDNIKASEDKETVASCDASELIVSNSSAKLKDGKGIFQFVGEEKDLNRGHHDFASDGALTSPHTLSTSLRDNDEHLQEEFDEQLEENDITIRGDDGRVQKSDELANDPEDCLRLGNDVNDHGKVALERHANIVEEDKVNGPERKEQDKSTDEVPFEVEGPNTKDSFQADCKTVLHLEKDNITEDKETTALRRNSCDASELNGSNFKAEGKGIFQFVQEEKDMNSGQRDFASGEALTFPYTTCTSINDNDEHRQGVVKEETLKVARESVVLNEHIVINIQNLISDDQCHSSPKFVNEVNIKETLKVSEESSKVKEHSIEDEIENELIPENGRPLLSVNAEVVTVGDSSCYEEFDGQMEDIIITRGDDGRLQKSEEVANSPTNNTSIGFVAGDHNDVANGQVNVQSDAFGEGVSIDNTGLPNEQISCEYKTDIQPMEAGREQCLPELGDKVITVAAVQMVDTKNVDAVSPFKGKTTDAVGDSSCHGSEDAFELNLFFEEGEYAVEKQDVVEASPVNLESLEVGSFPENVSSTQIAEEASNLEGGYTANSIVEELEKVRELFEETEKTEATMVDQSNLITASTDHQEVTGEEGKSCESKLLTSADLENEKQCESLSFPVMKRTSVSGLIPVPDTPQKVAVAYAMKENVISPFKGKTSDAVGDSSCHETEAFERNLFFEEGEFALERHANIVDENGNKLTPESGRTLQSVNAEIVTESVTEVFQTDGVSDSLTEFARTVEDENVFCNPVIKNSCEVGDSNVGEIILSEQTEISSPADSHCGRPEMEFHHSSQLDGEASHEEFDGQMEEDKIIRSDGIVQKPGEVENNPTDNRSLGNEAKDHDEVANEPLNAHSDAFSEGVVIDDYGILDELSCENKTEIQSIEAGREQCLPELGDEVVTVANSEETADTENLYSVSPSKGKKSDAVGGSSSHESEAFELNLLFEEGEFALEASPVNLVNVEAGSFPENVPFKVIAEEGQEVREEFQFEEMERTEAVMVNLSHTFTAENLKEEFDGQMEDEIVIRGDDDGRLQKSEEVANSPTNNTSLGFVEGDHNNVANEQLYAHLGAFREGVSIDFIGLPNVLSCENQTEIQPIEARGEQCLPELGEKAVIVANSSSHESEDAFELNLFFEDGECAVEASPGNRVSLESGSFPENASSTLIAKEARNLEPGYTANSIVEELQKVSEEFEEMEKTEAMMVDQSNMFTASSVHQYVKRTSISGFIPALETPQKVGDAYAMKENEAGVKREQPANFTASRMSRKRRPLEDRRNQ